ncbi:ankyrin repeat domain-containing protein 20B-like [Grus americana]|uniref:ankyrin repeat domain-containing protein 20B-like n=1 Tax=Grus americana TaxID=9117 RepID=UPI002407789A|nr:ankyrin repeat domain-containing protein 20B-like [Grus americana]
MHRLIGLLRSVRERSTSGSASAPGAAGASELREKGQGALHSAAASGDLAELQRRWWWWQRLRINRRDAKKQTPLHLACANGHADVVRFLAGKKCQLNPRDSLKKSPLMKAVDHQHKDCVTILLEHGAKPNLKGAGGNTALHMAAAIPSKPLVELLLEHNAHIDAQNELGYTPLTLAITERCEEMVEFLLQKGADVHARDKHERTPLMIAVLAGNMNTIKSLLRHGADLSHQDCIGKQATHYARELTLYTNIAEQLEEYIRCEMTGECSAGGTEGPAVLDSFCAGTAAHCPLGGPAMTRAGVLPAAAEQQEEEVHTPSDSKTDSEAPNKASAGAVLPTADRHGACTQSVAGERGNDGFRSSKQSVGRRGASNCGQTRSVRTVRCRGARQCVVLLTSFVGVCPAVGAEDEEDDDSWFDSEISSLESEKLQLKQDASAQVDCQSDRQRWVRQLQEELANALRKNSLAEASLAAKKRYSRDLQEQRLQLQKELDRSTAKLQELRERHIRTECYVWFLKKAIKNKKRELTTSRNLQGLLAASSATAAIPELEERMQRLQVGKARLEATAQQQAKTIEALQKDLQASATVRQSEPSLFMSYRAQFHS